MPKISTARVLLLERGELLLSRDANLCVLDTEVDKASQLRERGHAAADLGVVEVEVLKLSEILNEGQAANHLGIEEGEKLKLGEVLEEG